MNFKKLGLFAAFAVTFALTAGTARAQDPYSYSNVTCTNSVYGVGGTYYQAAQSSGRAYTNGYFYRNTCSVGGTTQEASTVATSQAVIRVAAAQTAGLISNRVANATSGAAPTVNVSHKGFDASTGIAGNGEFEDIGLWATGTFTSLEDEVVSTAFDGDLFTFLVGADTKVDENVLVGLSVGYETLDLDTMYNASPTSGEDGTLESDGFTVAPYVNVQLDSIFSITASGGYTSVEYDTVRFDQGTGDRITGNTDADRYFFSGAVNAYYPVDLWRIRGSLGLLYAEEEKDAFTETIASGGTVSQGSQDSEITQLRLNTEWGYEISPGFVPYAKAGIEYDLDKTDITVAAGQVQPNNDEDVGGVFGVGFRFNLDNAVTAGFEASTVEFRDDFNEYSFQGNLRVQF